MIESAIYQIVTVIFDTKFSKTMEDQIANQIERPCRSLHHKNKSADFRKKNL